MSSGLDFASFTDDERDEFVALMDERAAHGKEKLEALDEDNRALPALCDLVASNGATPGTPLGQALQAGYVSVLEVVESIRVVPDPLAE